jgi:hypothetical protein
MVTMDVLLSTSSKMISRRTNNHLPCAEWELITKVASQNAVFEPFWNAGELYCYMLMYDGRKPLLPNYGPLPSCMPIICLTTCQEKMVPQEPVNLLTLITNLTCKIDMASMSFRSHYRWPEGKYQSGTDESVLESISANRRCMQAQWHSCSIP